MTYNCVCTWNIHLLIPHWHTYSHAYSEFRDDPFDWLNFLTQGVFYFCGKKKRAIRKHGQSISGTLSFRGRTAADRRDRRHRCSFPKASKSRRPSISRDSAWTVSSSSPIVRCPRSSLDFPGRVDRSWAIFHPLGTRRRLVNLTSWSNQVESFIETRNTSESLKRGICIDSLKQGTRIVHWNDEIESIIETRNSSNSTKQEIFIIIIETRNSNNY